MTPRETALLFPHTRGTDGRYGGEKTIDKQSLTSTGRVISEQFALSEAVERLERLERSARRRS
jgi:hypothetical protein